MALDKNPEQLTNKGIFEARNMIDQSTMNSILYSNSFVKTTFLSKLTNIQNLPIIYLDFDLLYTGYINSGLVQSNENLTLIQPTTENWNGSFSKVLQRVSNEKCLVIIDSLNGFFNMFENEDSGRQINAQILLLSYNAEMSNSKILLMCLANLKDDSSWTLSLTGRQLIEHNHTLQIHIDEKDSLITLREINKK